MKQYFKIIDGQTVFATRRIIAGDQQIINPTHEQYIEAGWAEYVPEPVAPMPRLMPDYDEVISSLRSLARPQLAALPDNEALEKRALYDAWVDKIGTRVPAGERLYYDDHLVRVRQEHLVQEHYPPSVDTAALYEVIQLAHAGTQDDPIPYVQNMALELDKYYTQNDVLYKCYNPMQPMPFDLKDLAAHVRAV